MTMLYLYPQKGNTLLHVGITFSNPFIAFKTGLEYYSQAGIHGERVL